MYLPQRIKITATSVLAILMGWFIDELDNAWLDWQYLLALAVLACIGACIYEIIQERK